MTHAEQLIIDLSTAFDYTGDNNPDLVSDASFPMEAVAEELDVERSYQFLIAYIHRNEGLINNNFELHDR